MKREGSYVGGDEGKHCDKNEKCFFKLTVFIASCDITLYQSIFKAVPES